MEIEFVYKKNHLNLVPNDTTVWIVSLKNTLNIDQSISGEVLLFYDGLIEQVVMTEGQKGVTYVPFLNAANKTEFGQFSREEILLYFDNLSEHPAGPDFNILDGTVSEAYKKMLVLRYQELQPGEERHIFVQFQDDPNLILKAPAKEGGAIRFLSLVTVYENTDDVGGGQLNFTLTDADTKRITALGLQQFLNNGVPNNNPDTQFPDTIFFANRILDLDETISSIKRSHDPNQLLIKACECPANTDGAQKLICRVEFVNDGKAPTSDIQVSMQIPEELDFNSIPDTVFSVFPVPLDFNDISVSKDFSNRKVTWNLNGFRLEPAEDFGVGHPSTLGQITFTVLSNSGTLLDSIPALQACIVFDNLPDEVCTTPVKPTAITKLQSVEAKLEGVLNCEECSCPSPWRLLILIGLLLLALLGWIFYKFS